MSTPIRSSRAGDIIETIGIVICGILGFGGIVSGIIALIMHFSDKPELAENFSMGLVATFLAGPLWLGILFLKWIVEMIADHFS
ncbi:hypothetical protein GWN26_01850 [Candidatus Saccharibacteria bacterium]|nr:hypothetical protein [Calditrichia bacterium]NIV71428.1 hypothetical protein [Calditrichia bacterium]NIV97948.1 hypothetical protein [Candidatus Saccharibacteria bacterium]